MLEKPIESIYTWVVVVVVVVGIENLESSMKQETLRMKTMNTLRIELRFLYHELIGTRLSKNNFMIH